MRFRTLLFFISAAAVTIPCLVMGWLQYVAVEREFTEDDRTRAEISLLVSERLEAKVDNAVSLVTAAAECLVKTVQDPESKETAAELLESADEMKDMISRWLDVAKLQTGSYEIHPEFCLIKPMIRKALKHFSGFKDFECSLEISPDAAAANVDKQAFMQIIQNLLSNAYKYRKEGSVCRVKIQTRKLGDFLELMVEDDGIGVPESALDKIFDRFYQVRMDSARKIGGTGLGLYITKELVLLHKGKVTVASTLGEGTVFTLELPALPTETANEEEE